MRVWEDRMLRSMPFSGQVLIQREKDKPDVPAALPQSYHALYFLQKNSKLHQNEAPETKMLGDCSYNCHQNIILRLDWRVPWHTVKPFRHAR